MIRRPLYNVYAASCVPDGGIIHYILLNDGTLYEKDIIRLDRPMYFIKNGDTFHTILREPSELGGESGYVPCRFGEQTPLAVTTGGKVACHLCEINRRVYAVNYVSGSISEIGVKTVTHSSVIIAGYPRVEQTIFFSSEWQSRRLALQEGRQDSPHTHQIIPSPDGKHLIVSDLGLDTVFVYDLNLDLRSLLKLPEKSGIRHMIFGQQKKDGCYPLFCVCELDSTVCSLNYSNGQLSFNMSVESHISNPANTAAAIRLSSDARYVYTSQRGEDCISVFQADENGCLKWMFNAPCHGNGPRDFCLTPNDEFLLCANENSGTLSVLRQNNHSLDLCYVTHLPSALCVFAE